MITHGKRHVYHKEKLGYLNAHAGGQLAKPALGGQPLVLLCLAVGFDHGLRLLVPLREILPGGQAEIEVRPTKKRKENKFLLCVYVLLRASCFVSKGARGST